MYRAVIAVEHHDCCSRVEADVITLGLCERVNSIAPGRNAEPLRVPPAMVERADLLSEEAQIVEGDGITWAGRLRGLGNHYGYSGGSAADRRSIVEFMAMLEELRRHA